MDYQKLVSDRIKGIKPSGIRRFFAIASEMEGVISLGVGEPDFKTPWPARKEGVRVLEEGATRYTANAGMSELKDEISKYLKRRFRLEYKPDELFVTVGGSEAIDLCIRTLVNPGDEVLVAQPSFVCYGPIAEMCHASVVYLHTAADNGFALTAKQLKEAITPKTKLLVLPFPSNPTGGIMTRQQLEEIAGVLRGTDVLVLTDEIYAELNYTDERHASIAGIDGMKERCILVSGFSKAYAMTGWRLGYVCGPKPLIDEMLKLHQYAVMCAPTMSQAAAVVAMRECDGEIEKMRAEYDSRRKMVVARLNAMGLECFEPKGAFYAFPSIRSTGLSSEEFCERLLYSKKVAVIPGGAFGESGEGHVRLCYAYSVEHLTEALDKMEEFLKELKE